MDRIHGWVGRNERQSSAREALVRRADGTELGVTITDQSDEGCRIELAEGRVAIGEWIDIGASGSSFAKAQVRWVLGSSAGLKFVSTSE